MIKTHTGKIIVAPVIQDNEWQKGIIISTPESLMPCGIVRAVSEGSQWAVGDKIFYGKHFGTPFHFGGEDLLALSEAQVIGNESKVAKDKAIIRFKASDIEKSKTVSGLRIDTRFNRGKYACEEAYVEVSGIDGIKAGMKIAVDYLVNLDQQNNQTVGNRKVNIQSKSVKFLWYDNNGKKEAGVDKEVFNGHLSIDDATEETRDSICYCTKEDLRAIINADSTLTPITGFIFCDMPKLLTEETKVNGIVQPPSAIDTDKNGFWTTVVFGNDDFPQGTEVYCAPSSDAKLTYEGKTFARIRTEYILGKRINNEQPITIDNFQPMALAT